MLERENLLFGKLSSVPVMRFYLPFQTCVYPTEDIFHGLEELICQVYHPDTPVKKVEKIRWWLFAKRQAQAERLPPTPSHLTGTLPDHDLE